MRRKMKVKDKIIVVTGGGSGIGRELVLNLLARGASVAAVDLNKVALSQTAELAASNKDRLSTHQMNITHKEAVATLPEQVIAKHGAVDGIINNAGIIQPFVRLNDLDDEAIERVINVNLYGTIYMVRSFLPHLLTRPEAHITNISSMGGFLPVPGQTVYGASKAAIKLLTEGLYSELLPTNVRVTIVFPGAIGTNIVANSGVAIQGANEQSSAKVLPPQKAAEIIIEGIERNRYRVLVGSDAKFMDLLCRISPQYATNFIYKQMQALLPK